MSRVVKYALFVSLFALVTGCSTDHGPLVGSPIGDAPSIAVHVTQSDIDSGELDLDDLIERGSILMTAFFNSLDGAGRPESTGTGASRSRRETPQNFNRISGPDANSCSACHNLPRAGGGGDNVANVFVLAQAHEFSNFDGMDTLHAGDHTLENVGNERNTLGMFGSGFVELLAREMTTDLHSIKTSAGVESKTGTPVTKDLLSKGIHFGTITAYPDGSFDLENIEGVDKDLIIKPFHQKGAVVSLREFTNNAMNHHHGMQSAERFGNGIDADNDGVADELTRGDMTAITIFQATLPAPGQIIPEDLEARRAVDTGRRLFSLIGCATCHVPELRLRVPVFTEPNPYNPSNNMQISEVSKPFSVLLTRDGPGPHLNRETDGSVLVPLFSDLKRHRMGTQLDNEKLTQSGIPTDQWLTRKLWGMASEPPFLHHGRATLISEAISMHGGEAETARDVFLALSEQDQENIVEFLKTLRVFPQESTDISQTSGNP